MTADAVVLAALPDGRLQLEFQSKPCDGCAGACMWRRLRATRIALRQHGSEFPPGTEVTVALPDSRVLAASMLLHGMPLAAMLAGAAAGAMVSASDFGTLVGAVAGLGLAIIVFRRYARHLEQATLAQLEIQRKQ